MPLNPSPTIEIGLGLVVQPIQRNDQSRAAEVTFALNVAGVPSLAVAQAAITAFQNRFIAWWGPAMDLDATMLPPTIKLGDGSTTPFEAIGATAATAGSGASTYMPPNVAMLIKKTTGLGGRRNHGRTYLPFWLQLVQVNENGSIPTATLAVADAAAAGFLADLATATIPMCIAHKTFNVPLPPHYVTALTTGPLVTGYKTEVLVGTQRRRLGR